MASHVAILAECHSELLRIMSDEAHKTFEGLHQASCFLLAPPRLRKKMQRLETAYYMCRHLTLARTHQLQAEVLEWLQERRHQRSRVHDLQATQPQFYDVSDSVHREAQTDLTVGPQYVVREVWPEDPGYSQCVAAVSRNDDATAPSTDDLRYEGPPRKVGRHQATAQPLRFAGSSGEEHRCHLSYGADAFSHQEGSDITVAIVLSPEESGLGATSQPNSPWQVVAAASCQVVSSALVWTVSARDPIPQPFAAHGQPPAAPLPRAAESSLAAGTAERIGFVDARGSSGGCCDEGPLATAPPSGRIAH